MRLTRKEWTLQIDARVEDVWAFFSRPENLNELTPKDMSFQVLSPIKGQEMHPGMIIEYKIRPLMNIPMHWVTEITQMEELKFFIDEQRFGPYAFWHHQHHFEENSEGTLMKDILHYAAPLGLLGRTVNKLFIEKKIESIFDFRRNIVRDIFK